jgi:hypothetical protein
MTYWTRSIIVAAVALFVAAGCDSDSNSDETDAGSGDALQTEQADEPDTGSEDARTANAPDSGDDRPSATANEPGTIDEEPPLQVQEFLPIDQVQKLDKSREYTRSFLPGAEPGPSYNALRIHPAQGDDYGAGLQVWKLEDEGKAVEKFKQLKKQYLDVGAGLQNIDAKTFTSTRDDIQNVVVHPEGERFVYTVSCSKNLCDSPDKLTELIGFVQEELGG